MKGKFWVIFFVIVLSLILIGAGGFKMYKDNIDNQLSEGAKRNAIEYFMEKDNKKFEPSEVEFIKQMSAIKVYGHFSNEPEQKWYVTLYYSKTDEGYVYEVGSSGEVYADNIEEYLEQKEQE